MDDVVYKYKGHWYWSEILDDDKFAEEKQQVKEVFGKPVSDLSTIDTFILSNGKKYGIFTLVSAMGMGKGARFISTDSEPFPFDEIKINHGNDLMHSILAVRIGDRWGLIMLRVANKNRKPLGYMKRQTLTSVKYNSIDDAVKSFIGGKWDNVK